MSVLDNMKHKTKRRAPSVLGRFSGILVVMYLIEWARDDFTRTDATLMVGLALGAVFVYFDPPTVITHNIYSTPLTWKERIGRFF